MNTLDQLTNDQKASGSFHRTAKTCTKNGLMVHEQHAPGEHLVSTLPPSEIDAGHASRRLVRA